MSADSAMPSAPEGAESRNFTGIHGSQPPWRAVRWGEGPGKLPRGGSAQLSSGQRERHDQQGCCLSTSSCVLVLYKGGCLPWVCKQHWPWAADLALSLTDLV